MLSGVRDQLNRVVPVTANRFQGLRKPFRIGRVEKNAAGFTNQLRQAARCRDNGGFSHGDGKNRRSRCQNIRKGKNRGIGAGK